LPLSARYASPVSRTGQSIFISHASVDGDSVQSLVDLVKRMAPSSDDVFCTSTPGFGVPAGVEFTHHIKELLRSSYLIIHFITPAFLRSDFCMMELGASWVQGKAFPVLAPPLTVADFESGPLRSIQLFMLSPDGLDQLRDRIVTAGGGIAPTAGWAAQRDRAIREIQGTLAKHRTVTRLAAVGARGRNIETWAMDASGQITHSWWPRDDGKERWNKPYVFTAPAGMVDIAVASRGPKHSEVFALDRHGTLWHRWWQQQSWSGWSSFDGRVSPPITACSFDDGHLEVFAVQPGTNTVIHRWSWSHGNWSDWLPLDEGLQPE
jgi:hypothetical protein